MKIWLRAIFISFSGCVLSYFVYYVLSYSNVLELSHDYMITIMMSICIAVISYFGFNQPEIFNGKPIGEIIPLIKYKKTGLSELHSLKMKEELLRIMDIDKPYLKSDIRLDDIATLLGINRHQASQIINEHFNLNFYDFINRYRVEAAVRVLEQEEIAINMKEIAYDVGFNNYVSFYKSFKKYTGFLPTHFKKRRHSKSSLTLFTL